MAAKKPRTHRRKIKDNIQIIEGVWYAMQHDIDVTECCGCGLVTMKPTMEALEGAGRIWWRSKVNHQATTAARAKRGGVRIVTRCPAATNVSAMPQDAQYFAHRGADGTPHVCYRISNGQMFAPTRSTALHP